MDGLPQGCFPKRDAADLQRTTDETDDVQRTTDETDDVHMYVNCRDDVTKIIVKVSKNINQPVSQPSNLPANQSSKHGSNLSYIIEVRKDMYLSKIENYIKVITSLSYLSLSV